MSRHVIDPTIVRDIILTRRGLASEWPDGLEWRALVEKIFEREAQQG